MGGFHNRHMVAPYLTGGMWQVAKRGLCMTQTGTPYYASPEVWRDMPYDVRRSQLPAGASCPPECPFGTMKGTSQSLHFLKRPLIIFSGSLK